LKQLHQLDPASNKRFNSDRESNAIFRDGSLRCDMYEIFVETIFAFLSVACWVIPTGMEVSNSNKVIMLSS
jgi:hypothetical protein